MNKTCGDCKFCELLTAELEYDIFICTMTTDDKGKDLIVELEDNVCSLFKEI